MSTAMYSSVFRLIATTAILTMVLSNIVFAQCNMSSLEVSQVSCNDGGYDVLLNIEFTAEASASPQFILVGNGNTYGTYNYDDIPIIIPGFWLSDTVNEFVAIDSVNGNCTVESGFDSSTCDDEIDVIFVECVESDPRYAVNLSAWEGLATSFEVEVMESANTSFFTITPEENSFVVPYTVGCAQYTIVVLGPDDLSYNESITFCGCGDPVWPGDTNYDGVANNQDLLNIGLAYGSQDWIRPNASTEWEAQVSVDWVSNFDTGINFKHSDCSGNGVIGMEDQEAIDLNYNFTHAKGEAEEGTEGEPPLFVDFPDELLEVGQEVSFPIIFGSEDEPVEDLYGYAFTINLSGFGLENASISFDDNWLGIEDQNAISIVKHFPESNHFEIAFTRINQAAMDGSGQIGSIQGILIENVEGIPIDETQELLAAFSAVHLINQSGGEILFSTEDDSGEMTLGLNGSNATYENSNAHPILFPVPAQNFIQLMNLGNGDSSMSIYNSQGQLRLKQDIKIANAMPIDIEELESGVYFIEVVSDRKRSVQKFEVIK